MVRDGLWALCPWLGLSWGGCRRGKRWLTSWMGEDEAVFQGPGSVRQGACGTQSVETWLALVVRLPPPASQSQGKRQGAVVGPTSCPLPLLKWWLPWLSRKAMG